MRPNESQSARILVVDDDAVVRRMLSDTLGRAGYAVAPASSTTEALRVAADEEPALAIVDLVLPDGDGIELLGQLRASWPTLPALVVAACVELRVPTSLGTLNGSPVVPPVCEHRTVPSCGAGDDRNSWYARLRVALSMTGKRRTTSRLSTRAGTMFCSRMTAR